MEVTVKRVARSHKYFVYRDNLLTKVKMSGLKFTLHVKLSPIYFHINIAREIVDLISLFQGFDFNPNYRPYLLENRNFTNKKSNLKEICGIC